MGNVCGVVRDAIDYVLRYILPRYASYFPGGYNTITAQDINSQEAFDIARESDNLLIKDHDSSSNTERDENYEYSDHETTENTNFLLDAVSNFFKNYNFQMQVVSGRTYEKNLMDKGKCDVKISPTWQHSKRDEAVKRNRFMQPNSNITQEFISRYNDVKVDAANSNLQSEDIDGRHHIDISVQNGRRSTKEHFQGTESSKEKVEIVTKCNVNLSSNVRSVHGNSSLEGGENKDDKTQSDETLSKEQLARNFSRRFSHVHQRYSNDPNSDDRPLTDSRVREEKRPQARKLSLQRMHSGCHYIVNEGNDDVKLTDYSLESPPLIIQVESYRKISNPNLCSGGLVAFEELSRHVSIPDYYAENPIVYDELPNDAQFPMTSPLELPPQEPPVRPTSCSGGVLVAVSSRRVSLPDIVPERDHLLQAVSSEGSAQSLTSSGALVTDETIILSDLIAESLRYDTLIASQIAEETFTQPGREISRHASETEFSAAVNRSCDDGS